MCLLCGPFKKLISRQVPIHSKMLICGLTGKSIICLVAYISVISKEEHMTHAKQNTQNRTATP